MAQTPQAEATVPATGEPTPPAADAAPGLGNPTTILLLLLLLGVFWWSMRRRRSLEERLQTQRRQENLAMAEQSAQDVANIMRSAPPPAAAAAAAAEGLASAARMPAPSASPGTAAEEVAEARIVVEENGRAEVAESVAVAGDAGRVEPAEAAALRAALADLDNELEAPLGAIAGDGTVICPPDFPIKGNAQSRIYHEPGQASYRQTIAEFCFASAEAAEAAGFRQSRARGQRSQEEG